MSFNSSPASTVNHLYNDQSYTNITNSSNESHDRPSIFLNIEPSTSQPIFKQPNFMDNVPVSVPNVFIPPPFSPMVVPSEGTPWKCPEWMSNATHMMQFNSIHRPFKRKSSEEMNSSINCKQLITEEKMAAHLNSLHLSSDYTSHSNNTTTNSIEDGIEEIDDLRIEAHDLEEKLRRAQRITVCEEVRRLRDQPILPQAILERYEKPCTALVLWQPPQRISELIHISDDLKEDSPSDEEENNLTEMSSAATMDLDL